MTKKIFRSICAVAIAIFTASLILIMGVLYDYFSSVQLKQLESETLLCASAVEKDGVEYLKSLDRGDLRITWINADGTVIFDSKADTEKMENHLEREEIQKAFQEGSGESFRYSDTLMERQIYCARLLSDGTVLRLSASHLALWSLVFAMLQPILVIAVAAVALSLLLAYRLSKKIVSPLNELDLDNPEKDGAYEELHPLINRLKSQQEQLSFQKSELERKQKEFDTATGSMNEGIVLLSESGEVLSINSAACGVLGVTPYCVGKDLLLFNTAPELKELLDEAARGHHGEINISVGQSKYQFNASPVLSEGKTVGIALIILDITQREKAEQARREFTANVSHELKTPLQNISGSAELLSRGIVKPEDIKTFSAQIYTEAQRMITLVEDIIKLSHLDEGGKDMKGCESDLFALAQKTVEELSPVADKAGITLSLEGSAAELFGNTQLLSGIIYNLCDNAIKYNKKGGSVTVTVEKKGESAVLTVSDTGIGIPPEEKERIFERFYRVDKSRSKSVGGTGLGLSIVKHSVLLQGGSIDIESKEGEGTKITVTLPEKGYACDI